jgi:hypothetical protein
MDRISSCSIYVVQPDTQCSYGWVYSQIYICPTVFRTSQFHPQERLISCTSGLVSGNTRTVRWFLPLRCCWKNFVDKFNHKNYHVFHALTTAAHLFGYLHMCKSNTCFCKNERKLWKEFTTCYARKIVMRSKVSLKCGLVVKCPVLDEPKWLL